jgi:hypothetical protein
MKVPRQRGEYAKYIMLEIDERKNEGAQKYQCLLLKSASSESEI